MNLNGDPAPNPPPEPGRPARVTLAACRERLRAAIRALSVNDQTTPSAGEPTDESSPNDDAQGRSGDVAIIRGVQDSVQTYDDLLTNVSHDVKTSLTVIRGHAQMAARAIRRGEAIDPDALLTTLQIIDASAVRISADLDGWIDDDGR